MVGRNPSRPLGSLTMIAFCPFLGVARDVSFPVRILDENSFSRRKASHLSIARFNSTSPSRHMARSRSGGV